SPSRREQFRGQPCDVKKRIKSTEIVTALAHYNEVPWTFRFRIVIHDVRSPKLDVFDGALSCPRRCNCPGGHIQSDQLLGHRSKEPTECSRAAAYFEDARVFGLVEHCDQARIQIGRAS